MDGNFIIIDCIFYSSRIAPFKTSATIGQLISLKRKVITLA